MTALTSASAAAAADPAATDGRIVPAMGYRPHLDGLRAVAVYLVVLFHAGVDRFAGGFVGVDVFFVLSGFLVTQLLLRDVEQLGRVRLGRFYARRFRRLLPASFVVLVVSAVVFSAVASPVEVNDAVGGFRAAFLYVTNWYFIDQSADYFGADLETNPVLHFWSLAVEEQFYVVWPLVLGGLFAVGRRFGDRERWVVRGVVALVAVVSMVWALALRDSDPGRAYYGTDARAYQLMAGALLALSPGFVARLGGWVRWCRWAAPAGVVALVVVASSRTDGLDPIERGIVATVVTVALLVALEVGEGGLMRRGLSGSPVVYLGKISYGTYLWHWPVVLLLARLFDLSTPSTVAWTVLISTALASLSFQLMEHPIRVSGLLDRFRGPVIAVGLAVSVGSALVLIPAITDRASSSASPIGGSDLSTVGLTPVPAGIDFDQEIPPATNCYDEPASACTLAEGSGEHILLVGDSHASMLIPLFRAVAETHDLTFSVTTHGGCPWQRDLFATPVFGNGPTAQARCAEIRDDLYDRVIPDLQPDVIVLINLGYDAPEQFVVYLGPDGEALPVNAPELTSWVEQATADAVDELRSPGRSLVVIEPIPYDPLLDPLACLSEAEVVEECRMTVARAPSYVEKEFRRLDRNDDALWALDLDPLVCPFLPICDPIVDGEVVRADANHLTRAFAAHLAPAVADYLVANRIIEP